jgi:hypothetical protein
MDDAFNAGRHSHCLRVAAWAHELSGKLKLTAEEDRLLEQVALLHHFPMEMIEPGTLNRLAGDVWPAYSNDQLPGNTAVPPKVRAILDAMRRPGGSQKNRQEFGNCKHSGTG